MEHHTQTWGQENIQEDVVFKMEPGLQVEVSPMKGAGLARQGSGQGNMVYKALWERKHSTFLGLAGPTVCF